MTVWKKSSRCEVRTCVEVAVTPDGRINVRDAHGTTIELRPDAWDDILDSIRAGNNYPTPWIAATGGGVKWIGVPPRTGNDPVTLRYDAAEWRTFVEGVRAGEFDV